MLIRRNLAYGRSLARLLSTRASNILSSLGIPTTGSGDVMSSICPTTGEVLARVKSATPEELHSTLERTREAYTHFRIIPAPRRGELLRQIREALSAKREDLGALVSLEMGKIKTEGVGEVQEFVDICDYAVGLSRMMNGRVVASERSGHSILEVPNPLGVVAVLSAFNFPVAELVTFIGCGNATLWKPSPTTPLCAIAVTKIVSSVLERNGIPGAVASLVTGGKDAGKAIVESRDVELVSFTGSEHVGRSVGKTVASRFGKVILELGGNNASIIMSDADLSLAVPSVFFGAVGTAGQRCTSTRRLYLHKDIAPEFLERLQNLYKSVIPGDPLLDDTLLGPLHSRAACETYSNAIQYLRDSGAEILTGGNKYQHFESGNFVEPTIAIPRSANPDDYIWKTETFAPILNVAIFNDLEEAISWNNSVPQGLSSSLWTRDLRNLGKWIGPSGSDTGIVNVNVGTSGAEIGAAFGGNKPCGNWRLYGLYNSRGRESGGDSWKQYVRWSACTINFSDQAPLAQGVNFVA
ncbi:NAD-aldehyde dehydrogenase [Flammula alnicola]|nr:NAD-aldehyde dehydrogenase [Flammula alnicola]